MSPIRPPAIALATLCLVACGNRGDLYLESDALIERDLERLEDDLVQPETGAAPETVPLEPARRPAGEGPEEEGVATPSGADGDAADGEGARRGDGRHETRGADVR